MMEALTKLKARLAEISDLNKVSGVLGWDQRTMMAPRGAVGRSEQLATLSKIAFERFVDPETGRLLEAVAPLETELPYDSDDASLIRYVRRDHEKAIKVPVELEAEMARSAAIAQEGWTQARKESDFSLFLPHLERMIGLKRRYIDCLIKEGEDPYDVLLDDFEPGMKGAEVEAVFNNLKKDLVPLIAAIREKEDQVSDDVLRGHFPIEKQKAFSWSLIEMLGANREAWRLDPTVHPFASNGGPDDIRLTTRFYEDYLCPSLFATMHEFGHGLYEHQVARELERSPLCRGTSLGLHESQSRLWENLVGRSRPFWSFAYPKLQAVWPDALGRVEMETFYRAINRVSASFIRVEADEATYALHIILRFGMEREIIAGKIALKDVAEVWRERFKSLFGIDVPDDARGVLQDVHWSAGLFGYFPTYALGSIISSQIWEKITESMPDIHAQLAAGEFAPLREWLRENLHRHGRKFTPTETMQRLVGGPIDVGPFVRYLTSKFGEIYQL
ncbi:MAG: carboxypeptidase M32 [Opitutaceae bacterium]